MKETPSVSLPTRSLERILRPRAVAVVGASERPHSIGRALFENMLQNGFTGDVVAVNRVHEKILGRRAFPSARELPDGVDLAVIAVPADEAADVVADCGRAGVKGAIVISAGFREIGDVGVERERRLVEAAHEAGVRIIGPNCMGVIAPHIGLYATFATGRASAGSLGFASQSGALCSAILEWSAEEGVGFSYFLSTGAMADVGWADVLYFLADDPSTSSILLYMESVGDARSFMSAAREIAPTKPIIVMKAGRTAAAAKAAVSHTGALTGSDEAMDAAFRRCGVLRVDTLEDLFSMAEVLAKPRRPRGRRVAVVTNAGGAGVIAADALLTGGGELAPLSPATISGLDALLPAHWSHGNPVDVLGDATPDRFADTVRAVARDTSVDGVLVMFAPQAVAAASAVARRVADAVSSIQPPAIACWMGGAQSREAERILEASGIPAFAFPETAARTFDYLWRYSDNLRQLYETPARLPHESSAVKREKAAAIIKAQAADRSLLDEAESKALLEAYGIPTVPTVVAVSVDDAAAAADRFGYPVAVKLHSHSITHKSAVGGVVLDVGDASAVRRAFADIRSAAEAHAGENAFGGVSVQPMVKHKGVELLVGSSVDAQLGPLIVFGLGGTLVEALGDHAVGLPPLNATLARLLMQPTHAAAAVKSVAPGTREAVVELLVRFAELIVDQPRIRESDLNPVLAWPGGVVALDARFVLYGAATPAGQLPRPAIRPYPAHYTWTWSLPGDGEVLIRPIRPEDEPMMRTFHAALSTDTVYFRYAHVLSYDARARHENLARRCFIDYDREIALIAIRTGDGGASEIAGIARIMKEHTGNQAELAIVVADRFQHRGLGRELTKRLIGIAKDEGVMEIVAHVLASNDPMQRLCERLGFTPAAERRGETTRYIRRV